MCFTYRRLMLLLSPYLLCLVSACESVTLSPPESIMRTERDQGSDVPLAGETGQGGMTSGNDLPLAGETAAGETAAGETAAGETAAGETSAGETSAGETSAGETSAGETAAGETAAGETSAGETSAGETSAGDEYMLCGEVTEQAIQAHFTCRYRMGHRLLSEYG